MLIMNILELLNILLMLQIYVNFRKKLNLEFFHEKLLLFSFEITLVLFGR
jgi:hypothetical protein